MSIFPWLSAAIIGVVEGLTEFIPVSSTGHMILLEDLIGFQGPPGRVFEIVIQLGAILAICVLYARKLFDVAVGLPTDPAARRFTCAILLAFAPAVVLGVAFHGFIKSVLFSPLVVAVSLVAGGIAILIIERLRPRPRYMELTDLPLGRALAIGVFQCLAMVPGVSRSGATIMGALLLGVERKAATEFSFFLAIPTMLGATVYDLYKNRGTLDGAGMELIAIGFVTAFLAALLVVRQLVSYVGRHGFAPFAIYRIIIGALMLGVLWLR